MVELVKTRPLPKVNGNGSNVRGETILVRVLIRSPKPNADADGDDEYKFDGVITAILGLSHDKTKSSLKAEARAPSADEPANKRFKKDEAFVFSDKDPIPPVVPHHDAIII